MNDEILKDLLSDILQQQVNIIKLVEELKLQQNKASLEPETLDKHAPVVDDSFKLFANKFFSEFDRGLKQLTALSALIPGEVNSIKHEETKIVLFSKNYNEGHYGLKELLSGLYCFLGFCLVVFLSIKYIPAYIGDANENLAYKQTLQWYHYKSDKKGRNALQNTLNHFKKKDTLYTNELERFQSNSKN